MKRVKPTYNVLTEVGTLVPKEAGATCSYSFVFIGVHFVGAINSVHLSKKLAELTPLKFGSLFTRAHNLFLP
jgi:hypothetical protein